MNASVRPWLGRGQITCIVWAMLFYCTLKDVAAQTESNPVSPEAIAVHVGKVAASPMTVADPHQVLIFDNDSLDREGSYQLPAGEHTLCLSGGGGVYTAFQITTSNGEIVTPILNDRGCATISLSTGLTTIRLLKRTARKLPAGTSASIRVDPTSAPPATLVDKNGNPLPGYWAIQDTTVSALGTFGNRVFSQQPQPGHAAEAAEIRLASDSAFDGLSLWQLPDGTFNQIPGLLGAQPNVWSIILLGPYIASSCGYYCGNAYGSAAYQPKPGIQVIDDGNYSFRFNLNQAGNLTTDTDQNGDQFLNGTFQRGDEFQVIFRFFPQGLSATSLQPGEVALYQGCGQQGKASVFIPVMGVGVISPPYNLAALNSPDTTLVGTTKSVAVGPGASVYWGTSSTNIQGAVASNTPTCLSNTPTGQIFVEPLLTTLTLAHDLLGNNCAHCSLKGETFSPPAGSDIANFVDWDLTGMDFSHATISNLNLSGAKLTGAKFAGATLTNVNLNGVQLGGTVLDFTGATLTNVTFAGVDVSNFIFTGATLNNINLSSKQVIGGTGLNFTNAILNQVNLSGQNAASFPFNKATLCGISLSGTDQYHLLDLTSGNFSGATVILSSECAANLTYTILIPDAASSRQWNGMNLTGSDIMAASPNQVLSSQANPLKLGGAILTGTSIQNFVLDYAQGLAKQNLTQASFNNSSLRFTDLSGAILYGATFTGANLEGANMSGVYLTAASTGSVGAAHLDGAFLRNVNLSQARLSGADFTNASFYSQGAVNTGLCTPDKNGFTEGCASASGALMDGTNFTNAYLFGVDFTSANGLGVNFSNAILTGANFGSATITSNATGANSSFAGALLQGADLSTLHLQNRVSLSNAYVDFTSGGNTLTMTLSGQHTTFAGYWGKAGEPVCAQMAYAGPTLVPATNANITCPDQSNNNPDGCGIPSSTNPKPPKWASTVDITQFASYAGPSTYTPAPPSGQQICTFDPAWIPLVISGPAPNQPHSPKPPAPPTSPKPPKAPSPPKPPKQPQSAR
jgi:uncharacterized protein YjbI with pentapeptide repeats